MINNKVQLITYPDSIGKNLKQLEEYLDKYFSSCFGGIHILPPYPSSGDRGFAPIDYLQISPEFGDWEDIKSLGEKYQLMVDLMVNHISQKSTYFQDYLKNGENSKYKDFFINLNDIWEDGIPLKEDIDKIFLRRARPYSRYDAKENEVKVWTTFGKTDPSEQIDLDVTKDIVRDYFIEIFTLFQEKKIKCIRLDAIGYVVKKLGTSCFFVEPDIYDFISWIYEEAKKRNIEILPEVHSHYNYQLKLADKGYWIYDFILPYTILEAIVNGERDLLVDYLETRPKKQITMLDCHDGIPVLPDLEDKLNIERTLKLIEHCKKQGANFSVIINDEHKYHGIDVHQINCTFYDALERDDEKYILARAIQFFTEGIPQVYYVGLLAGENDYNLVEETKDGRFVNRHNFTEEEIAKHSKLDVVKRLVALIKFRNSNQAFNGDFKLVKGDNEIFKMKYSLDDEFVELCVNVKDIDFEITYSKKGKLKKYRP